VKPRWTHVPPSVPGFYWLRVTGEFEPEIVRVFELQGSLQIHICGSEQPAPLEGGQHEWFGPLLPPS
jgi:hypothetical protein